MSGPKDAKSIAAEGLTGCMQKEQARAFLRDQARKLREAGDFEQAERVQNMADGTEERDRFYAINGAPPYE